MTKIIRALYKTGFFKDVRLRRDGAVLIVVVQERPAISEILFEGNKSIDDEDLSERIDKIMVTHAVGGMLDDLTPEEMEIFDAAVEGRW